MKRTLLILILAALVVACGPSKEERIDQIEDLEDSIFESAMVADEDAADQLTQSEARDSLFFIPMNTGKNIHFADG